MPTMDDAARSNRPEEWEKPEVVQVPVPAATVVLVRDADDGADGVEVLLARRNSKIHFAGGAWVFPGGRIDPVDHVGIDIAAAFDEDDPAFIDVARAACAREAAEEAGATIDPSDLVMLSHWTPPIEAPKRFSTWFFIGPAPTNALAADMGEIDELAWMRPSRAMARRNAGEIDLIPPTYITLSVLQPFATVVDALAHFAANEPERFVTRFGRDGTFNVAMYHGDAGYDSGDPNVPGARHRLTMAEGDWRYERD